MKTNQIAVLVGAAALAVLALIGFQVSWIKHSRSLLDEQFQNRVNMALCSSVEKIAQNQACSEGLRNCCAMVNPETSDEQLQKLLEKPEVKSAFTEALQHYQIDTPYTVSVSRKDKTAIPYSCSLQPIVADDSHMLQIHFPNKADYFQHQMGVMVSSSIALLLFICSIFGLATFYLIRQKRMSDRNRDFFNHLMHEFRTPLTNIRLAGSLLGRKNQELGENQYLGIIRRECDQLTNQVENVLYLAGLEKGDYHLQKAPVDLNSLTKEVIAGMDLQIRAREAQIEFDAGHVPHTIQGDAFHLSNALRNIIDNALKYSTKQPVVSIAFQQTEGGCHLRFTDNGAGLPDGERGNIFRKFHRCANAVDSGEKGFGLGLAYVKKIMDMHRGRIDVYSAPGKGAQFDLFFPLNPS